MTAVQELKGVVQRARKDVPKREFSQAFELTASLQDIDFKKQPLNVNEIISLPNGFKNRPTVCIFATGDLALRAKRGGADVVLGEEDLTQLASKKRDAKKLAKTHDFFLAEAKLMVGVGKSLGTQLGPLGKMPTPIAPNAPIDNMIENLRTAIRMRCRNQYSIACKVGDESMDDEKVSENVHVILNSLEEKLPSGSRNVKNIHIKLTMGHLASLRGAK